MPKKSITEQEVPRTVECAICHIVVKESEYFDHVKQFHANPQPVQQPVAQAGNTGNQPAAPSQTNQPSQARPESSSPPRPVGMPGDYVWDPNEQMWVKQIGPMPAGASSGVIPGAPPPPAPRYPFVNAQVCWQNGGSFGATITGVRNRTKAKNSQFEDRGGYSLDLTSDRDLKCMVKSANGQPAVVVTRNVTAGIGIGDTRHNYLWNKYGQNWIGAKVVIRGTTPADNTKANWTFAE